jgi:hypothetical protein
MSENNKVPSMLGFNIFIASVFSFIICLFLSMLVTGDTAYKIQSITEEFQNLDLVKDNVDLIKKTDNNFTVDKIHNVQNNLSLLVDDPKKNKTTTLKKLISNGYSNLFFTDEKNNIVLNSVNYTFTFCDNLESLINQDPRKTISGKIAFKGFWSQDEKKYNESLNNFYETLKNKTIKINGIKVDNKNKDYQCNRDGNNKIEII